MPPSTLMETKCKFCGEGRMHYNQGLTFHDYSLPETFVLDDIDKVVDGIIKDYLVYVCDSCGSIEKLTYKEIERVERKRISKIVMHSAAKGEIEKALAQRVPQAFIYCGKCNGADGHGACPVKVYKECELKKLPNEL